VVAEEGGEQVGVLLRRGSVCEWEGDGLPRWIGLHLNLALVVRHVPIERISCQKAKKRRDFFFLG
jgi:hypothetical protein